MAPTVCPPFCSGRSALKWWLPFSLLISVAHAVANTTSVFNATELRACYRQPDNATTTLTFDDYMTGSPARLHLYSVIEVASLLPSPESVLTLATALNADRLDSLAAQCQSWPGPLVAALYHPVVRDVQDGGLNLTAKEEKQVKAVEKEARLMIQEAQKGLGACKLRVILLYDFVDSDFMAALLPINALRNVAILGSTTPLVAMIDVDLLVGAILGHQLVTGSAQMKAAKSEELIKKCSRERGVVILPAFQTPKDKATNAYPKGGDLRRQMKLVQELVRGPKDVLYSATQQGTLIRFASQQFSVGHRRTNFPRWFEASAPYQVEFIKQFEPWYIVDRVKTPFYDVNFRGYGRNKQQQAAHCDSIGMSFWVHPDGFLIHMPHEKSKAQADHDKTWMSTREQKPGRPGFLFRARRMGLLNSNRRLQQGTVARQGALKSGRHLQQVKELPQGLRHVRRVDTLFRKFVQQMPQKEYQTLVDPATYACLGKLPWWNGNSVKKLCTTTKND